jgi:hypothetical protein
VSDQYTKKLASTQQKDHTNHSVTLAQWVARYPTPKTAGSSEVALGGDMNPTFVEWLMGIPSGWSGLKPLETGSYQQWLSAFSREAYDFTV